MGALPRLHKFVISHPGNNRKAMLASPGYDLLGERSADGTLSVGHRGFAIVRHG